MSLLDDASLLVTPNAEKAGKLYSIIPTNGNGDFSVTRATTATRVNAAGLVELVPYNLLQQSEMFSQAVWTKTNSTIAANTTTAPNGTLTADTLTRVTATGLILQSVTQSIGTTYAYSIWLKGSTAGNVILGTSSGAVFTSIAITTSWQRYSFTRTAATASDGLAIYLTASTLQTVDIWGAQINEGTSALDYQATETRLNILRIDYSLGSCPNILLEPQRTNLALRSEEFENATWIKDNSSVTANSTISPSGIQNADTYTGSGGISSIRFAYQVQSVVSGTQYTISIYAKKNTNNFIQLLGGTISFGVNAFANFDLNNGVVGTIGSAATARIENVGNGWYRCSITAPAIATITTAGGLYSLITSSTSLRAETNTLSTSVFLWGAQLEAGNYSTSYIPTTSASVTRNLDVVQKTGVSSLIGQTEGTIYWEGTLTSGLDDLFSLNRSTLNSVVLYKSGTNTIVFRVYYGGSFISLGNATAYTGTVKIAASYKSGNSIIYINGVQVGTSSTAFTFTGALTDVVLNNSAFFFGNATKSVKTAALFPTRLTNAQLAALTA